MNILENIISRRSIRKFNKNSISSDKIETILKAAMYAPSACNEQTWEFVVIDQKELLEKIPLLSPHAQMAKTAPLAILVCHNVKKEKTEGFFPQDLAAATQNLMLAAHSLGIGSVWTGLYPRKTLIESFSNEFNLPDHIIPFSLIILGYPEGESKEIPSRFCKEAIHYNQYP
ncbi:MAG TPA: nitroreductase family protein [Chlamydiales bacterium]|nr:nitroreductase family protein [Chlamydiales bacterium]